MTARALAFGSAASAYERFRPGYPDELVDAVLDYAGFPIASALEIGAGTGKATRVVAARGITVTASDPDPAMLAELHRHVPDVATVQAPLEQLRLPSTFDLVYAAASLHWTEPESRWSRVASLLRPQGVFASFGGPFSLADAELAARVREVTSPFIANVELPAPDGTSEDAPMAWPGSELVADDRFADVRQLRFERRSTVERSAYVGYLSSVSAYLQLAPATRVEVLGRIAEALPARVHIVADLIAHLARRSSKT